VRILAVASIAVGRRMGDRGDLADLVPEGCMTGGTFDLMIRHVFSVKGLRAIFRHEDFRFVMALKTFSFRHVGIPLDHAEVTLLAGDPSFDILAMVEVPAFDVDIAFGGDVTGRATSHGTGDAVLLSLGTGLVIVADETIAFMNRQVGPLDDLGMTRCTAEFHASSHFF